MYNKDELDSNSGMNSKDTHPNEDVKQLPKKVKLEITTDFERNTTILIVISVITTISMLSHYYEHGLMINPFTLIALAVSVMLIILRLNIDEYYVLDMDRQALMLRKKLFSSESYTMFAHFNTIEATVGSGQYNSGGKNSPGYWEYRAEIILRTGKVVPIDDWHKEALSSANRKAQEFARAANADFVPGRSEIRAKPTQVNGKHTFIVKEDPPTQISLSCVVVGLAIMTMVGGMGYYAINFL